MASEVDICNLALGNLGNPAEVSSISPQDGSVEAMHCARFYPMARKALLEMHTWGFATRRASLALLDVTPPTAWLYAYAHPNNCLRPVRVLSAEATDDDEGEDFKNETLSDGTKVIYANTEDATLLYTHNEKDPVKFSGLFTTLLARLLSSMLAGPLIKGDTGSKIATTQTKVFYAEYAIATGIDANSRKSNPYDGHTPAGITARA